MKEAAKSLPENDAPRTQLVLVDEQSSIRGLLRDALGRRPEYEIVGEGRTGTEALRLCRQLAPQVLIMDLMLREVMAATVLAELHELRSPTKTLVFTGSQNEAALRELLAAHPRGLVHKDESLPALWLALATVAKGGYSISPRLGELQAQVLAGKPEPKLTVHERMVLQMLAESEPNKGIAEKMGISLRSVEHTRTRLMKKHAAHDLAALTRWAIQLGLLE